VDLDDRNTLTSITAWRYWDWGPANDRDYTALPIDTKVNNPTKQNQYTQEFRFNHKGSGYDFVVGLFGFHQAIRTSGIQETGSLPASGCSIPPMRSRTTRRLPTIWSPSTISGSTTPALRCSAS